MRILLKNSAILLLLLAVFAASGQASAVSAATLSFDPSSVNTKVGDTFKLTIKVEVGTAEVIGVDALVKYDKSLYKVVSVSDGTFLTIGEKDYATAGLANIVGIVESAGESVTGSGPLADITFESLAKGTGTIEFACETGETGESNISEGTVDAPDLIECSQNGEAVVVATGGSTGSTTGGTTTSGGTRSTGGTNPSQLPKTGIVEDIVTLGMIVGGFLVLVGAGTHLLASKN